MAGKQPNVAKHHSDDPEVLPKALTFKSPKDMFQEMEKVLKVCGSCGGWGQKHANQHPDPQDLKRCIRCRYVYYCSKECQRSDWSKHKDFCKDLRLAAVETIMEWLIVKGDLPFPTEKWSKPPFEVTRWKDWLDMQVNLPAHLNAILNGASMETLWSDCGRPRPDDETLKQSVWSVCSDFFSRPLTIAWGMRLFNLDPHAKPLTIHLVGAGQSETLTGKLTDYDELNNMFPEHQGIEVVLVGPELVDGPFIRPPLRALGPRKRVFVSAYRGLYHQFWEELVEREKAARPDLVVGFHPGFSSTQGLDDGWLPTLLLLRDYEISSVFTARTEEEMTYSLRILTELEVDMRGSGNNPFFSLRHEVVSFHKPIIHCNSHYFCFQGSLWTEEF